MQGTAALMRTVSPRQGDPRTGGTFNARRAAQAASEGFVVDPPMSGGLAAEIATDALDELLDSKSGLTPSQRMVTMTNALERIAGRQAPTGALAKALGVTTKTVQRARAKLAQTATLAVGAVRDICPEMSHSMSHPQSGDEPASDVENRPAASRSMSHDMSQVAPARTHVSAHAGVEPTALPILKDQEHACMPAATCDTTGSEAESMLAAAGMRGSKMKELAERWSGNLPGLAHFIDRATSEADNPAAWLAVILRSEDPAKPHGGQAWKHPRDRPRRAMTLDAAMVLAAMAPTKVLGENGGVTTRPVLSDEARASLSEDDRAELAEYEKRIHRTVERPAAPAPPAPKPIAEQVAEAITALHDVYDRDVPFVGEQIRQLLEAYPEATLEQHRAAGRIAEIVAALLTRSAIPDGDAVA